MNDDRSPEIEALRQKIRELTQVIDEKDQKICELVSQLCLEAEAALPESR